MFEVEVERGEMHRLALVVFAFSLQLTVGLPSPIIESVIVQIQKWTVVGTPRSGSQSLLNGVSLTDTSSELNLLIKSISAEALPMAFTNINNTSLLRNHTILRSRECILEGSQLHFSDRVFYDGTLYLSRDHGDVWAAHGPKALALKEVWDQEAQLTGARREVFLEVCLKLMKELKLSEAQGASVAQIPWPQIIISILAVIIMCSLIIISFIFKNHGLRHPGGVTGSIIHYPKDMAQADPENNGYSYQAL